MTGLCYVNPTLLQRMTNLLWFLSVWKAKQVSHKLFFLRHAVYQLNKQLLSVLIKHLKMYLLCNATIQWFMTKENPFPLACQRKTKSTFCCIASWTFGLCVATAACSLEAHFLQSSFRTTRSDKTAAAAAAAAHLGCEIWRVKGRKRFSCRMWGQSPPPKKKPWKWLDRI